MFDTVSSKVSSTISGNRKVLQLFFVVLILLEFAPFEVLGPRVRESPKAPGGEGDPKEKEEELA